MKKVEFTGTPGKCNITAQRIGQENEEEFQKKAHIPLDDSYPYNLEVLIILESPLSDSTDFH